MDNHDIIDEATRSRLRIRYSARGAAIGVVVVFGLLMAATRLATPDFGIAFAVGVSSFMALWAGSSFGVIFGNAAYEARFGHKTDAEDVAIDDAEIHSITTSISHDRAA
ncbi:MAG: hypothetical protein RIE08_07085 [Acidimicrobiales bacterium]